MRGSALFRPFRAESGGHSDLGRRSRWSLCPRLVCGCPVGAEEGGLAMNALSDVFIPQWRTSASAKLRL